jgi:hypothetical protein
MKIFISYRRKDSAYVVGRIRDRLTVAFGESSVFRDIIEIPSGIDFRAMLESQTQGCNVMLVVIGPHWADVTNYKEDKLLFDPKDFIRIEVENGLKREEVLVIPVLINGAVMPGAQDLPGELGELAYRNAITVRDDPNFDIDMERLIRGISRFSQLKGSKPLERTLKVFLCHASQDKPYVRELYKHLISDGVDAWLDEEKLLPGQDWDSEIMKAVKNSDAVIVCLSNNSIKKEGYVQKELRSILEIGLEKPDGTIFIIPVRLDDCQVPARLQPYQYVNYFPLDYRNQAYNRIRASLEIRGKTINST